MVHKVNIRYHGITMLYTNKSIIKTMVIPCYALGIIVIFAHVPW